MFHGAFRRLFASRRPSRCPSCRPCRGGLVASALLALVVLLAVPLSATAGVILGAQAGLNSSTLKGDGVPGFSYQRRTGLAAGLIADIDLTDDVRLSLQPSYVQRGTGLRQSATADGERIEGNLRVDYLTLPILVRIMADHRRTYIVGGVDIGYRQTVELTFGEESEELEDVFRDLDLSMAFGFGVMFPLGRPTLTTELRYTQSVLNIADPANDQELEVLPRRFRFSGFQLLVGILIPLGGP